MKLTTILLCVLISFSVAAKDVKQDTKLVFDAVLKVKQAVSYYEKEVYEILERYETEDHVILNKLERNKIQHFWTILIDYRVVLHSLYNSYKKSGTSSYSESLIKYTSNLHLQLSAAIMSKSLWSNKGARKKLNETNLEQVPRGSFINMENEIFRNFNSQLVEAQLPTMFPSYSLEDDYNEFSSLTSKAQSDIDIELESINEESQKTLIKYKGFLTETRNISEVRKRFFIYKFKNIFYAITKKISTWLGDTKVRNRNPDYYNGQTLINLEMAKKMEDLVRPGDVMISRTNWFLSNAFLPGFWPHSFLYIGAPTKMRNYFSSQEVNKYFLELCKTKALKCNDFFSFLEKNPKTTKAFKNYLIKDKYGHEKVLVEGTSDGIHFSSIRHTFLNDYLAAMRPVVSKLAKAKTIVDAFENFGIEYDFDFDYQTDDKLVCTELVAKSYEKRPGKDGFSMNYNVEESKYLEVILGRLALPVINFVHKIYDENVLRQRKSDFEFVAFLKGMRKQKTSKFSTEKEFYESRNWKKWSFMRD